MLSSGNHSPLSSPPVAAPFAYRPRLLFSFGFALLLGLPLVPVPAVAQRETWRLEPGSRVGPETEVKPTNCVTAADGTVTCDTKLENPKSITPAKPSYNPFPN